MAPVCDFCSSPEVVWRYPAHNFIAYVIGDIAGQSVGDWAACPACKALIEAGDRVGLADRSAALLITANPEMASAKDELVGELMSLQSMFFANQCGQAVAVV